MKSHRLNLFVNGTLLGELAKNPQKQVTFQYSSKWLDKNPHLPLSRQFPVRSEPYKGDRLDAYLRNLLPDSEAVLNRIAANHHVASTDPFDLLTVIGKDCIGAVQFLRDEELSLAKKRTMEAEKLTEQKIAEILRGLRAHPLGQKDEDDFRISIAGIQEKTALLKKGKHWYRPLEATPTTHILKPSVELQWNDQLVPVTVENEWLCLTLCQLFGLEVAHATIESFDGISVLAVERFDRIWSKDKKSITRVIQEDFCQATGTPPHLKYQNEGGPSIKTIMDILQEAENPTQDRYHFFKTQMVFWLLAAIDGHAKNFSVRWSKSGLSLTPLYDVISAEPLVRKRVFSAQKLKLAMSVGESRHYRVHDIQLRHWEQTAHETRFPVKDLHRCVDELIHTSKNIESKLNPLLPKKFPGEILEPILNGIQQRFRRLT